jgi:hypothetical protein
MAGGRRAALVDPNPNPAPASPILAGPTGVAVAVLGIGPAQRVAFSAVSQVTINRALLIALILIGVGSTGATLRLLTADPAPGFWGGSLRRAAVRLLGPSDRGSRTRRGTEDTLGTMRDDRWWLIPPVAFGLLALPVSITWGPLANASDSTTFLDAMWVVVAASLGLSVAMVAFAFQAFMTSGRRLHGGTLLEFADETGLLDAIRLGVLSLLVTGTVLLKVGHDAPRGWAAAWACMLSVLTLLAVPYVVKRVVVSLDERELLLARGRRLRSTVAHAMYHQLIGQAAEAVLTQTRMPISRALVAPQGAVPIATPADGEVRDIKLGRLARAVQRRRRRGEELQCHLAVGLGDRVQAGRALLWLHGASAERPPRWIRRCVVLSRDSAPPDTQLLDLLASLHQQGLDAAREGRYEQWRQVADGYELVLLALPPASATFEVPFSGAVAAPGFFGVGPLQRIQRYLFDEAREAVKHDHQELIDAIAYFPAHIATKATAIGAPVIAATMLALYPSMYILAQREAR